MVNTRKLTLVAIILIILISSFTLYYKRILNDNLIDKSYAYNNEYNKKDKYLSEIKKRIYEQDKSFNENNYLITYNETPSYPQIETINLTYTIDNLIETNKSYKVIIENETIKDIYKPINCELNEIDLIKRVNEFMNDEKEEILYKEYQRLFKQNKILNKDKSINQNRFINDITRYEEKYLYNCEKEELSYYLSVYHDEYEEINLIIK